MILLSIAARFAVRTAAVCKASQQLQLSDVHNSVYSHCETEQMVFGFRVALELEYDIYVIDLLNIHCDNASVAVNELLEHAPMVDQLTVVLAIVIHDSISLRFLVIVLFQDEFLETSAIPGLSGNLKIISPSFYMGSS